jgi:hypothetical protein
MINMQDFVLAEQDSVCASSLTGVNTPDDTLTEPVWILGSIFMKNLVTVFDLGKPAVGFGNLHKINSPYGTDTLIPESEATALGTGPSASVSPTFIPSAAAGDILYISFTN